MSKQCIIGNWKMNGQDGLALTLVAELTRGLADIPSLENVDIAVCPPSIFIDRVSQHLKNSPIKVGGQDCHYSTNGAHTGDISARMLKETGADYVILGHSERRIEHHELDEVIHRKAETAQKEGLTPVVCVGESQDQRSSGQAMDVIGWQISGSIPKNFSGILAYEPVWAIGTGVTASLEEVTEMHNFIRQELVRQLGPAGRATPILYGGSVNAGNAASLLALPNVNGALIGGASLDSKQFLSIIRDAIKL